MPDLDQVQLDQFAERRGINAHVLLWISARNRSTGGLEQIGFWTGDDHRDFEIDGQTRTYFGAGDVIDVAPIVAGIGLTVRQTRITLPPMVDAVRQMARHYDPRLAPVEVHVSPFNIDTGVPLGAPRRMLKGKISKAPEDLGAKGGRSKLELILASNARALTFGLPLMRSGEELQRRNPSDRGREYSDVAGEWVVSWGE